MRIKKFSLWSAVAVLGLVASLTCENRVHAQVTTGNDLYLGGSYNTFAWTLYNSSGSVIAANEGGGAITPSTLNGASLPWVYCVDIPDNVYVPANYNNTTVTTNGTVTVTSANPGGGGTAGTYYVGNSATIAGQIAWILDNYANAAIGNTGKEEAVQAAIWKVIYGTDFTVPVQDSVNIAMNTILSAMKGQTAAVNSVYWLSPGDAGSSTIYQALVTANVGGATLTAPEPSTFAIAGLGAMAFVAYGLRRRKALGA